MDDSWANRGFLGRVANLRVVLCLCILQSLVLALPGKARSAYSVSAESAVVSSIDDEYCGAGARGDGEPAHHAGHSDCCILCSSNLSGGLLRFAATLFDAVFLPAPPTAGAGYRQFLDDRAPSLIGWTSSWSSRAPPSFS